MKTKLRVGDYVRSVTDTKPDFVVWVVVKVADGFVHAKPNRANTIVHAIYRPEQWVRVALQWTDMT